jgi:ATP-binding cassette, subfamily C, bacterial
VLALMNFSGGRSIGRLASFVRLFTSSVPPSQQIGGLVLVLGASLTEGISISLLGPLLGLIGDPSNRAGSAPDAAGRLMHAIGLRLSLPIILAIFVAAVLCRAVSVRKRDMVLFDLQQGFTTTLRRCLYCAIEEADWPFIAKERLSHLVKALTADVESVAAGTFFFLQIPATATVAAVQLAIALGISPLLTCAVIGCGGIVAILVSWRRGGAYQAGMRTMEARRATFDEISDFVASIKLAKSHNAEERHRMAFEAALARQNDSMLAVNRRSADAHLLVQVAPAVILGPFVYAGVEFAHLSAPELVIMIVVFSRLMPGLMGLQQNVYSVRLMLPVFDHLRRLIARCQAAREPLVTGGADRLQLSDKIKLSGIRFRYDKKRGPNVLNGLDLEIAAGSVVALVGTSGAGKSTVADLIMGLQVPDAGSLTVDGQLLTGPRLAAWRRSVAYISQENFLFNQSIRANLLWSAPDASDADLRRVLALTGADCVVATMLDGLDTMVGERGARLSGGERQRLILARALLRNPALLILDEATNALDQESERAVWAVIDRLRGSTTVIVISHRLSTLRSGDHIAVFGGRIVQFGKWDALTNDDEGRFAVLLHAGAIMEDVKG